MATARAGLYAPRAAPPAASGLPLLDEEQRGLMAVLRRRARFLLRRLPAETAALVRLVPVLFQASFAIPSLRKEPPGIAQLRYRRSWIAWSRLGGLPPPLSMQRQRGLLDAVLALPRGEGIELLCFVAAGLHGPDRPRLLERFAAVKSVLAGHGKPISIRLVEDGPLEDLEREGCLVFGGLLAGTLPPALGERRPVADPQAVAAALAELAPSPMAAAALMLLAGSAGPSAAAGLRAALRSGTGARLLADPASACASWAGPPSGQGPLLETVRRWLDARAGDRPPPAEVIEAGRALALACASAVRRLPRALSLPLRARLRRDVFGPGLPRVLLPLLDGTLLKFEPAVLERRKGYQVRLADGTSFGNGRTLMHARVRALALRAAVQRPVPSGNALSDLIEARLARPVEKPTLFLALEHLPAPGPPFDPLNRGPERLIGIQTATAVRMRPGGRPSGWRLRPVEAVRRLCLDALAGLEIEVVALAPEGHPVAARLLRVAAFLRKQGAAPGAVEAGGAVLLQRGTRVRALSLKRFATRPLAANCDPEAFDLALSPERGTRPQAAYAKPNLLECRVYQIGDALGCVLTADDSGRLLREEVRLDRIEDHLREARALLLGCAPPAMLAARLADQVEQAIRLNRRTLQGLPIAVGGELPHGLWVEVGGERLSVFPRGGWSAAAQALLSGVAHGAEARLSIDKVAVTRCGAPAAPIFQLYARSLVLRRLGAHLRRELARAPGSSLIET